MFKKVIITFAICLKILLLTSCGSGGSNAAGGNYPANSNSKTLTAFSIVNPSAIGIIDETSKTVSITVPLATDVTNLVANFTTTGKSTTVNNIEQISNLTANDFSNSITYTIKAEDETTADYTINITKAPGDAKSITSFSFPGIESTINESAKTIGITLPYGTDVTSLSAVYTTTGKTVTIGNAVQTSGVTINNFTNNVIYTVVAEDDSTADYTVSVSVALNSSKTISSFSILGIDATINESARTIGLTLPYGTDVTALTASFTTTGSSVEVGFFGTDQVSGFTSNDFTSNVVYTVNAEDGSKAEYTVSVSLALNSANVISAFSILDVNGIINETTKTIGLTLPYDTDVTSLVAAFSTTGFSVKVGSTIQVSSGTSNNFTDNVIYTVVAENGSEQNYTVNVTVAPGSAKAFTAFSINGVDGIINESTKTVGLTLPYDTDVTSLVAAFTTNGASVKVGSTIQVSSGTANNFTTYVTYTVVAVNGSEQNYTVTVARSLNSAKAFTAFSINGVDGIINETTKTIGLTLPSVTDVTSLVAEFSNTGVSVKVESLVQVSGGTSNNFTNNVIYTVVAENGSEQNYTVTVTRSLNSAKAFTAFSIGGVDGTINESAKTIGVTLSYGADITDLAAAFSTTGVLVKIGITEQFSGTTSNNFTNNVIYTVVAENGSEQNYTVNVSVAPGSAKAITAFSINGISGTIDESTKTIGLELTGNTDVTSLVAVFSTTGVSVNVGVEPQVSENTPNDFTNNVTYTVVAENGSSVNYTVAVRLLTGDSKAFTGFSIDGVTGDINEADKTINLTMPYGTDVTALKATFAITGVFINIYGEPQISGTTPNDFTYPVNYTVVAGDGSEEYYWVIVSVALNDAKSFTAFSISGVNGTINESAQTIGVILPYGTAVTSLPAVFIKTGVSVKVGTTTQVSGSTRNNFTTPVIYKITAEDGSIRNYTVTVSFTASTEKKITSFYLSGYKGTVNVVGYMGSYIEVVLPSGTNLTNLAASFETTGVSVKVGETIQVSGITSNNFTEEIIYTVYAENGSSFEYVVYCTLQGTIEQWARNITGSTTYCTSEFLSVKADSNGNIYAAGRIGGYFSGSGEFRLPSVNGDLVVNNENIAYTNVLLVKYNSLGQALWAKTVTGGLNNSEFESVAVDSSGNVYAAGYIYGKKTFDFGNDVKVKSIYNYTSYILIKYNSSGLAQWAKIAPDIIIHSLSIDNNDNIYGAGKVYGSTSIDLGNGINIASKTSGENPLLVKYNTSGEAQWAITITEGQYGWPSIFKSVYADNNGNVYAVGYIGGSVGSEYNFGNGVIIALGTGGNNAVLVKYNSSGTTLWAKTPGKVWTDPEIWMYSCPASYFNSVNVDNGGNVYVVGYVDDGGAIDFGNNTSLITHYNGNNFVLVKYNPSGDAQWAKTVSSGSDTSQFNSVSVDNSGNIFAAGYINGTLPFGLGDGITVSGIADSWNSILVKYNTSGTLQWAKTPLSGPGQTRFSAVSVDNLGHAYTAGFFQGAGTFDFGDYATSDSYSQRCVMVKYNVNY